MITWAYGITTVPQRLNNLLLPTINSLAKAGFDRPRLFIDGFTTHKALLGLEVTCRSPKLRTFGNWILALWEIYLRNPRADRYAMFQDDLLCCSHLREYLEQLEYPGKGYWNLCTHPQNLKLANGRKGFYESNQLGRGALALVFSREVASLLLQQPYLVNRPQCNDPENPEGHQNLDGGIVTAIHLIGGKEWIHNPSLVMHTGKETTIEGPHKRQPMIEFPGETYNPLIALGKP